MNTQPNWDALQQLHDKLAELRPHLIMRRFISNVDATNLCATSCCLAGWGMEYKIDTTPDIDTRWQTYKANFMLNYSMYYVDPSKDYLKRILGEGVPSNLIPHVLEIPDHGIFQLNFQWLFSGNWSNDIDFGLMRLNYFIQNKSTPAFMSSTGYINKSMLEFLEHFPTIKLTTTKHDFNEDNVYLPVELSNYYFHQLHKLDTHPSNIDNLFAYYSIPNTIMPEVIAYLELHRTLFKDRSRKS